MARHFPVEVLTSDFEKVLAVVFCPLREVLAAATTLPSRAVRPPMRQSRSVPTLALTRPAPLRFAPLGVSVVLRVVALAALLAPALRLLSLQSAPHVPRHVRPLPAVWPTVAVLSKIPFNALPEVHVQH